MVLRIESALWKNTEREMCHPKAAERTQTGLFRVQKGRCYLKPPLGNYRTAHHLSPYHCYTRNDSRERLAFQPHVAGDIDSLKRCGLAVPNKEEVIFNSFLVTHPWAVCKEKPIKSKRKPSAGKAGTGNKNVKTYCYVPSFSNIADPAAKFEKRKKQEFRHTILRMGFPAVFGEYLNKPAKTVKSNTSKKKSYLIEMNRRGSVIEQNLIDMGKKSTSGIKQFTANRIPWKSFLQPQSLTKVATATSSFVEKSDNGKGSLESWDSGQTYDDFIDSHFTGQYEVVDEACSATAPAVEIDGGGIANDAADFRKAHFSSTEGGSGYRAHPRGSIVIKDILCRVFSSDTTGSSFKSSSKDSASDSGPSDV